jgi:hypothetical protein
MAEDPVESESKDDAVRDDGIKDREANPLFRVMFELKRVKNEPRLLVIVTHGLIELIINTLIDAHCKNAKKIANSNRDFPHSAKLTILNEKGVLSDHHYQLLNWFRKLRNDAAHDPFFELTKDRMSPLADPEMRKPERFCMTCQSILTDLWLTFEDVVGPAFLPTHYTESEEEGVLRRTKILPGPKYLIPLESDPKTIEVDVGT